MDIDELKTAFDDYNAEVGRIAKVRRNSFSSKEKSWKLWKKRREIKPPSE